MADKEYRDLAPISDIEDGKEYLEALNWALDNPKIKNIALTGPYGAGKSSIIDTFLKQNSKKQNNICKKSLFRKNMAEKSIKISMATFAQAGDLDSDEKIHIEANEVEEGILKQLFYKVEHKKIPQSRYRKLHVENFKTSLFKVIALTTMMVILGDILKPEVIGDIWKKITEFTEKYYLPEISSYIILGIYVIAFVVTISHIWSSISTRYHVKEITLPADAKVEKDNNLSESVFNKNLDEIMYFFEATGYRIVFFEDLDRLDDRKIFVHLRELNNLLNNDDTIKEKPIVFIYAVKDDIFTKDDRTKFFDFIIPVIPVINSTNSGEILLKRLQESEKNGIQHNISSDFIFDVSPYISDMRVLQNIYNEFVIYKNLLSVHQALALRDEQMMAMIIFKNLYPKDFADIQNETGIIKKAFEESQIVEIETVTGASGGVIFTPTISDEDARSLVENLCERLSESDRILPGGYLYLSDLLSTPSILKNVGRIIASAFKGQKIDAVMTVATKGVPLANAVADVLNIPFVIVRRDLKITEGSTVSVNYVSGSSNRIEKMFLSKRSLKPNSRVLIVDDFLKGGGTITGMISLLSEFDSELVGVAVFAENAKVDRDIHEYKSLLTVSDIDVKSQKVEVEVGNIFDKSKA